MKTIVKALGAIAIVFMLSSCAVDGYYGRGAGYGYYGPRYYGYGPRYTERVYINGGHHGGGYYHHGGGHHNGFRR
ncbi:hypothetical protein [Chryseobacterium sp. PMSZPI]|uniref:hypothetical protein n=1 Tax=Chryseobacterium sp. PMSZPI TaxID=1033900 RepID=UPI000C31ED25|nr:hypothetical protein [Chryseobacterium sp. PMSZPI]PKF75833.1 hypothetical protein CW752_01960 [Chryseobacterium sp. PMSZPI]